MSVKKHRKDEPAPEPGIEPATSAAPGAESAEAPAAESAPAGEAAAVTPEQELHRQVADLNEKYLRARADLENFRRRAQRELAETREYTQAATVEEFLPVLDHFNMAVESAGASADLATLRQGMEMILAEFKHTLDALGVQVIDAAGAAFDPALHEAVATEPSETVLNGHVLRQWKRGYRMGARLLRPATVIVSSGPPATESAGPT